MQDKKLLQIGEVAKIFHVSMGTLRHYEQAGLLDPEYVDEKTGYRYYGVRQLEVLNTIRYLRVLDLPLSEIRSVKYALLDFVRSACPGSLRAIEATGELNQEEIATLKKAMDAFLEGRNAG